MRCPICKDLECSQLPCPTKSPPRSGKENFLRREKLQQQQQQQQGPFLLVGDFNAMNTRKTAWAKNSARGPHLYGRGISGIGDEHDKTSYLIDFCSGNKLLVANTWFQKPQGKQVTFAQLDLCLVPSRWQNACVNV